jgi:hypothetical protein
MNMSCGVLRRSAVANSLHILDAEVIWDGFQTNLVRG